MAVAATVDDRVRSLRSPDPRVRVWALHLDVRDADERTACLGAADRQRVAELRTVEADRLVARRALTRAVVAGLGHCPADALRFPDGPGPRTVVVPGTGAWFVSSSTSGSEALLALGPVPVGIDLEALPGPPDALRVSEHLLPAAEHAWILAGGPAAPDRFLATWVRKEAVVKCTGEGLSRDLRSFVVDAALDDAPVRGADGTGLGIRTGSVSLPGHAAALAVAG
jgi:4'-phosphopantetheinyl transferase